MPSISGEEAVAAFERAGFELDRIKGSHHIMKKGAILLSIPVHPGKDVGRTLLKSQIKAAGMTVDEFIANLRR